MKKHLKVFVFCSFPILLAAQNSKVQTAWRNLDDYRNSKDVFSLNKAKEAIDLATNHEDTKDKPKTWMYRANIYYEYFRIDKKEQEKKFAEVKDKEERQNKVYGNVSSINYEEAAKALQKVSLLDKDNVYTPTPDFGILAVEVSNDMNNFAVGKYSVGKYDEAMAAFDMLYESSKIAGKGRKDTAILTNALVCATKAQKPEKIKYFSEKMISEKIPTGYSFYALYQAKEMLKDTAGAMDAIKEGRKVYPSDINLMNAETDFFLKQGKGKEALANLDLALQKDPKNPVFYIVKAGIYYDQANPPKDAKGNEAPTPKDYYDLVMKAEENYKKATELEPKNADTWVSLGANYNNWAGKVRNSCDDLIKQATKMKECEAKAMELFNKAIAALETALGIHPTDKSIMNSLRRLYLYTNQPDKAAKMSEQIKAK